MTNSHARIPDLATRQRLLANLRRTHLAMEELNLELAEMIAKLESDRQQQRLKRVRDSLNNLSV
ncbi:MAG: hypothetical protein J7647_29415 [Cyanobacteria bacterium SBLK]|nr:hypothetical protein [Cyanobacteria bacterium SBLK]